MCVSARACVCCALACVGGFCVLCACVRVCLRASVMGARVHARVCKLE